MSTPKLEFPCLVCHTSSPQRCSQCHSAFYCGQEHIRKDWKRHKPECLKIREKGIPEPLPTVDAILFAVDEDKPRLIKVPYTLVIDEDDESHLHKVDTKRWYYHEPSFSKFITIDPPTSKAPRLEMRYDDNYGINGSPVNRCILNLLPRNLPPFWCGTVIGFRDHPSYQACWREYLTDSVLEEDLPGFVNYLTDYTKRAVSMYGAGR